MKTKKKLRLRRVQTTLPPVTNTTRQEIGHNISFYLDLINDPRFKHETFRQIEEKSVRSYTMSAANNDVFISFSVEWKGGNKCQ